MADPFVIIGANMAGGAAAYTLRARGFDGPIALIGAEPHPPYERPPLSKEYLRGEVEGPAWLQPEPWYADNGVELKLGVEAVGFDPARRRVRLRDATAARGEDDLGYSKLLLATGGRNRPLTVPGSDLDGVCQLRTLDDCTWIRGRAATATNVVIAGAGFIGSEVAASLRTLGREVDVVDSGRAPLAKVLGPEVGGVIGEVHREHGVRFHHGQRLERIEGDDSVERVVTDTGTVIACDLLVAGIGIVPNTDLAEAAGLDVGNGIAVDEGCRTSAPDVYAAGDVADRFQPLFGRRLRVEHFDNALKQGEAAASSMIGGPRPADDPHWFWSDQFDVEIQYAGFAPAWDGFVVRGSLERRDFLGFYLQGGAVRGVVGMNRGREVRRAMALIRARAVADLEDLRDERVDVKALASRLAGERESA